MTKKNLGFLKNIKLIEKIKENQQKIFFSTTQQEQALYEKKNILRLPTARQKRKKKYFHR